MCHLRLKAGVEEGGMSMNMNLIQYALEIDRCCSINKAAKNLYISQPALSRAMRELEQEIGIMIFSRTPTGVVTTHQGKEFLLRAGKLNEQYTALQEQYYDKRRPHVLNLSVSSIRYAVIERAFTNVYNRHRDYEFQNLCITEVNIEEVLHHVYDGLYAVGFLLVSSDWRDYWKRKADQYNLSWISLRTQRSYIQVGEHHPLADRDSVCLAELVDYPHATMAQNDVSSILSCSSIRGYDFTTVKKRIVVNDKSMMYEVLTHTDAYYIGVNLEHLSPSNGQIRYIPISDTDITLELVLVYLRHHTLTALEQEFVDEVRALLAQNPAM